MTDERDRRVVPRAKLSERPTTRMQDGRAVRLLDVSRAGAGIEHLDFLRPGASCSLELPPPFGSVSIPAQVVWCRVIGRKAEPGTDSQVKTTTRGGGLDKCEPLKAVGRPSAT